MDIKKPISASELASILAVWTVAIFGCRNVVSSMFENYFPQYFKELLKPDSPMFGISERVNFCILLTVGASSLLFFIYDSFTKKINDAEEFLKIKLNHKHIKEILTTLLFTIAMVFNQLTGREVFPVFIFCLLMYIYPSNKFSYLAKMALIPAALLIMFAFILPSEKNKQQEPYIISTTCEGLKDIKVIGAIKVGNFVELTTETDTFYININTITRIQEIRKTSEGATKTPQPTEQK